MSKCTDNCSSNCNWDELILDCIKSYSKPNYTIFDIGANVGNTTENLSQLVPQGTVYAIEMDTSTFEILSQREFVNNNVKLLNVALSDKEGEVTIYSGTGDSCTFNIIGNSSCAHMRMDHVPRGTVKCVTLDWLVSKINIQPDILKVDVEGAESKVLAGAKKVLQKCKLAIIENHEHTQFYQLLDILADFNMECFCLKGNHRLTEDSLSCYQFIAKPK